jgi:hypothetical protein
MCRKMMRSHVNLTVLHDRSPGDWVRGRQGSDFAFGANQYGMVDPFGRVCPLDLPTTVVDAR